MSFTNALDQLLAQARAIQKNVNDAATKATEQMHPLIQESIHNASELQATLTKQASELTELTAAQAQSAIVHLNEFGKLGQEAAQKTAEQARQTLAQMAEQSKQVVDTMAAAWQQARERGTGATTRPRRPRHDGHIHEGKPRA